jgi:hypothetical protein
MAAEPAGQTLAPDLRIAEVILLLGDTLRLGLG